MCVRKRRGAKGGGAPGVVVGEEVRGIPSEGHGASNLGSGKGELVTRIRQA